VRKVKQKEAGIGKKKNMEDFIELEEKRREITSQKRKKRGEEEKRSSFMKAV